jgi:S-DNA-T family DNA segregation ATPase FtsK/SpoIIIE
MAKKTPPPKDSSAHPETKGLLLIAFGIFLTLCFVSFDKAGSSHNWLGLIGHAFGFTLSYLFGLPAFAVIALLFWSGWKLLSEEKIPALKLKLCYFSLFLLSSCVLINLITELGFPYPDSFLKKIYTESIFFDQPYPHRYTRTNAGGVPLYFLYKDIPTFNLEKMLSNIGIAITFSITLVTSFLLFTEIKVLPLIQNLMEKYHTWQTNRKEKILEEELIAEELYQEEKVLPKPLYKLSQKNLLEDLRSQAEPEIEELPKVEVKPSPRLQINTAEAPILPKFNPKKEAALSAQRIHNGDYKDYVLPPASLLITPKKVDQPSLKKELKKQAEILEETLMSFGIEAKVGEINCGPTITSFEVHPAIGVKVQKITALENDIALNLQAKSLRIIAPIPGKAAVGVEIPSLFPQEVSFKEMLTSYQNQGKKLHIPVLLGKTVSGEHLLSDLAKMPHCIIAGATGSGKSVCINTLVMSIVMNAKPDEIKLLLVDPKKVELTGYTNLPHLLAPVITEPHGAYAALNWLVQEMTMRYEILRQLGLRNIHAFNSRHANKELEASLSISVPERMFSIVAIIDEFADLMMVSSSDLETPIARIAQMARAVGIHLVLATQRPSREVITGLIKANFPTRIAFKVASRINSQIILDESGADTLLGNGDMLFLPPGSSQLIRAQGVYISDEEINKVISFVCRQAPPNYLIASFDAMKKEDINGEDQEPKDSLYEQALSIVVDTQTASTTFLQRKLKIGYARAASLIDELESNGVIAAQEGSRPRRVLGSSPNKKGIPQNEEEVF